MPRLSTQVISKSLPLTPQGETIGEYVKKVREIRGLSKAELARQAKVDFSTVSRIESGETAGKKMKIAVLSRFSSVLQIPIEYLQAAARGEHVEIDQTNNVCTKCWNPGSAPDIRWSMVDAKFCLRCGTQLINKCTECKEPIWLKARFCPQCGKKY
jgi:transcriptional regulator with XRE-family HTH domain